MKKLNILILLLAFVFTAIPSVGQNYVLTSVIKKDITYLTVDDNVKNQCFDKEGGVKYVDITSNLLYTVTSNQLWCSAETVTLNGKRVIKITVQQNAQADLRTATLTIKAKDNLVSSIDVTQIGTNSALVVTEKNKTLYDDTYDFSLEILTSTNISFETPNWITQIDCEPVVGLKRYKFQATEYLNNDVPRTGDITIKTTDGSLSNVIVPITQIFRGYPRFAVISDIHFGLNIGEGAMVKVPKALKNMVSKNPDAIFILGDLTNGSAVAQWQQYKSVVTDPNIVPANIPIYAMMGNHDHYVTRAISEERYKTYTGQPLNQYINIKGYPFITISISGSGYSSYSAESVQFLKESLEDAAVKYPGKPIFVFTHVPSKNTVYGSYANDGNFGNLVYDDLLKNYPQVILITGHTHYPLGDPRNIYQNYYTSVSDGGTAYSVIENGTINAGIHPDNYQNVTEGLIVSLDRDKNVTIERRDTYHDEEILPKLYVNAPHNGSAFLYKGSANTTPPVFAAGTIPTVSTVTQTSCNVTFPQAAEVTDDVVHHYIVEVLDGTTVVATFSRFSEFYLNSTMPTQFTVTVSGLPEGKTLKAQVKAVDAYFNASIPIVSAEFTTLPYTPTVGSSKPDANSLLLDVSFNANGSATDNSSLHNTITTGTTTPITYLNSTYNTQTAKFVQSNSCFYKVDYQNDTVIKNAFANGFTFETLYMTATNIATLMHPFSALESGGAGLMQSYTAAKLFQFRIRFGSAYKDLYSTIPVVAGKYYHVIVSYDKTTSKIRMYIDGVLAGESTVTGTFSLPANTAAQWIGIGGDAGTGTTCQNPLNGEIVTARMYNRAITRDEVYWLYQEVKK